VDGNGGYIKWFTDGDLVSGIFGDSLTIMETEIPSEPMYMLMNTAVSSHWGFPTPCPDNCECDCFECGNPTCACALPPGYCANFPASFEIDYVRVYQAVNETRHVLGCSPAHRPTELFIQGHAKRFISEGQAVPLQPVRVGGGACLSGKHCGGSKKGSCTSAGVCECLTGWTGPHCRSHDAFYDVDTRAPLPPFSSEYLIYCFIACAYPFADPRSNTSRISFDHSEQHGSTSEFGGSNNFAYHCICIVGTWRSESKGSGG